MTALWECLQLITSVAVLFRFQTSQIHLACFFILSTHINISLKVHIKVSEGFGCFILHGEDIEWRHPLIASLRPLTEGNLLPQKKYYFGEKRKTCVCWGRFVSVFSLAFSHIQNNATISGADPGFWSGGPDEFGPQGGPWAQNLLKIGVFPLKNFLKTASWGRWGPGPPAPPGSGTAFLDAFFQSWFGSFCSGNRRWAEVRRHGLSQAEEQGWILGAHGDRRHRERVGQLPLAYWSFAGTSHQCDPYWLQVNCHPKAVEMEVQKPPEVFSRNVLRNQWGLGGVCPALGSGRLDEFTHFR